MYSESFEFKKCEERNDFISFRGIRFRTAYDFRHVCEDVCGEIVEITPQMSEVICLNENTGLFRVKVPNAGARKSILLNAVKLKVF